MTEYVRILSGNTCVKTTASTWRSVVEILRSETDPGEGWHPVIKGEKPEIPAGHELGFTYTVNDGVAHKDYFTVPLGTVFGKRVFSKLKTVETLMKEGLWPQVKSYIEQSGLYDIYLAAQNFREDNDFFKEGLSTLQEQLGLSDEKVEEILNKCIVDR